MMDASACNLLGRMLAGIALLGSSLATVSFAAAPSAEQRAQVKDAEADLRKAANLFRAKKFAEAGKLIEKAQDALATLASEESAELADLTGDLRKRLSRASELLQQQGVKIRPPAANSGGTPAAGGKDAVSFSRQIAPLLVARCGGCHVQRSRGEFSMATFAALDKGSTSGVVFMAGNAKGSRMVELIEAGDMPRGGGKVSPEELALIVAWIDQGAKYDGPDRTVPLASFRPAGGTGEPPKLSVVPATGQEEVQFARDLGKVLLEHCVQCHGEQNPRANFSVSTYARLLAGGDSGPVIVPDKPAESLLVKKLRGMAGERMPLNKPALPEETIVGFEKWIAEGARFDGDDAAAPLEFTVALVAAKNASHDELRASRADLAARNWRLVLPDARNDHEETEHVLVYGTVARVVLAEVAKVADEQTARLARLFKTPKGQPFVKGGVTLYVFDKHYDYGEIGTMLEKRQIPEEWRGHWQYNGVDAYGCVLLEGDQVPASLVAQQLAGAYVASLGKVPRWFAEGSARAAAATIDRQDPRVKSWDDQVGEILKSTDKPAAFLTGELSPESSDVLSYSFVKYLLAQSSRYTQLLAALRSGTDFDKAFVEAYRDSPAAFVPTWANRAGRRR